MYANWLGAEDQQITFSEPIHRFIKCVDEQGQEKRV
jgi:hypothetical protein